MMFKASIAVIVALALASGGLYWRNDRLSTKLQAATIRAENAEADLRLAHAATEALSVHTARKSAIADDLDRAVETISQTETANAPVDPNTVDFIRSLGLLAE